MNGKQTQKKISVKIYSWQGKNRRGEFTQGEISATNLGSAKALVRSQGIDILKIKKKSEPLFTKKTKKKIKPADICVLSRQLATMMTAGIPLVQSIDIMAKGAENPSLKNLLNSIKTDIESGKTLAESFNAHPKYFNALFTNLVNAGEQSGSLDIMLDKVATYQEKSESLKKKIKKAMTYPIAIIIVALVVTVGLLIFVVPQFESLFKGFGADLPAVTKIVVSLSEFFQSYWWLFVATLSLGSWAFFKALETSREFAYSVDRISLKIPIIGDILKKAAIARFSRTLAITFAAGLPLVDALKSVAGTTGNLLYSDATLKIREQVATGQQMNLAMRDTHLFPNVVIQMVGIGEESGALETMLSKVADFYEEEVDTAVDSLSSLLEPIIMSILGILIGGLVIAMYMPIFKLGAVV